MVGHPARGEQTPRHTLSRLAQEFEEGGAIAVFAEDSSTIIAPVEDMVAVPQGPNRHRGRKCAQELGICARTPRTV